jgi:V/A-type H+-transporting ATPase subunit F
MYKIAVLGGTDTVLAFKALGLDTFPISDDADAKSVFKKATDDASNAIIYLEERFAAVLADEISAYHGSVTPAIILIPGREGSMGLSLNALRESVLKAVGTDVL